MSDTLPDETWLTLLERIRSGRCTPFLGAGASFPALPLGSTIAADWAREYQYPGDNPKNLVEVAQFLAVKFDTLKPKEKILKQLDGAVPPDFSAVDEPHGLLADLPLPIYLTTNYDDFMVRALKSRYRDARRELCRWNTLIENEPSVFDNDFIPTVANPVVFHLHGHTIAESIVLTEDDYLYFLANIGREKLLPKPIQQALIRSTCVFIGYRLADWNFRVLFQGLRAYSMAGTSIAVLKPPGDDELARRQRDYLDEYYGKMNLKVYWGTAREFAAELRERWKKFSKV
jgi:SIR2-like protein